MYTLESKPFLKQKWRFLKTSTRKKEYVSLIIQARCRLTYAVFTKPSNWTQNSRVWRCDVHGDVFQLLLPIWSWISIRQATVAASCDHQRRMAPENQFHYADFPVILRKACKIPWRFRDKTRGNLCLLSFTHEKAATCYSLYVVLCRFRFWIALEQRANGPVTDLWLSKKGV